MKALKSRLFAGLMHLKMLYSKHILMGSLLRDAEDIYHCQESVLMNILSFNRLTEIGNKYNFNAIENIQDFIKQVPISEYEEIRPYVEKQIQSGDHAIVSAEPIMYAQTSGTIGKAKYIPIISNVIDSYKRAQSISSFVQYDTIPGIFSGKVLAIVSPAIEGYLNQKTPYGSMSGLVYENMPEIVSSKYVLPTSVFQILDYEVKYRLIAAFSLCEGNITCLATANPSTLLKITEVLHQHAETLISFVATGDLDLLGVTLDAEQKRSLAGHIKANVQRSKQLFTILRSSGKLSFSDIWPNLRAVVTWTGGNCALQIPKLKLQLSEATKVIEMGYLSSEFRGTITVDCNHNLGIPTIQDNFFEFVQVSDWEQGIKSTLLLSQLEIGKKYYIIVTTINGLYRYFINDIIEVTGRIKNTPTIAFVQKGKGVTNLTGEKLYESQVAQAFNLTIAEMNIEARFFIMLADQHDFLYTLYIESDMQFDIAEFGNIFNRHLGSINMEYMSKAASGRIKFAVVKRLSHGTHATYKESCIKRGQREGQFKFLHLQYNTDVKFPFEEYVVS